MWKCEVCGEEIADQFDACWRCAANPAEKIPEIASTPTIDETHESVDQCVECGSKKVIPNAVMGDQGHYSDGRARIKVESNPTALLFKGTARAEIVAKLCCACGAMQLRAVGDLEGMWQAYTRSIE